MAAKYLWIFGSLIFTFLGFIHVFFTFFTKKFSPRTKNLECEMKSTNLILTKQTTIWNAWIGFNASHSIGAIFIGIINIYLVGMSDSLMQTDHFYKLFNILTCGFYLWLAKKYWFKTPFIAILIAFICFIISYIFSITQ